MILLQCNRKDSQTYDLDMHEARYPVDHFNCAIATSCDKVKRNFLASRWFVESGRGMLKG